MGSNKVSTAAMGMNKVAIGLVAIGKRIGHSSRLNLGLLLLNTFLNLH